ncbi:hypothetical protein D7Y13_17560 [Corallococcus praedator]|uniref:YecA family protein n=1 Tax=Corallococcus praedator TaxID=2316724 RepID=A0ABX9QGV8_9BACT|nr:MULTISPECIES: hypothetical protein [Corallococcus]RKH33753.1 hypothetical protein D7X75_10900 [Corallococcus sp. CA031C]RKI07589.1 hypothetical protein D7Y13_17560 [Corallococcus praedator]
MEDTLTLKEAYAAMYEYMSMLYQQTASEDLGGFLGGMSLLANGEPADPAVWADWLHAVQKARKAQVVMNLGLKQD